MKRQKRKGVSRLWWTVPILAAVAVLIFQFAQRNSNRVEAQKDSPFNEQRAARDLQTIVGFGPRPAEAKPLQRHARTLLPNSKRPASDLNSISSMRARRAVSSKWSIFARFVPAANPALSL